MDKITVLFVDSVIRLLDCIHEDIFEKNPRGQPFNGQQITWHRCKKILKLKDEILEIIEKAAGGGKK